MLRRLDISIAQALEPCSNLKATGRLLESYYRAAIESGAAPAEAARLTLASYYGNGDPEVGTLARYPQRVAAVRRTLASDLSTLRVKDPSALGGNPLPQRPLTEGLAVLDQPASRQALTTAAPASLPEPEPLSPTIPPSGPRWDVFGMLAIPPCLSSVREITDDAFFLAVCFRRGADGRGARGVASRPAAAQTANLQGILQKVVDMLTGEVARLLAIIAVIIVGIAWMFGYLDLRKAAYVVLGVAIVFGASEIVSTLTGT